MSSRRDDAADEETEPRRCEGSSDGREQVHDRRLGVPMREQLINGDHD
jgi:hypothetical protein